VEAWVHHASSSTSCGRLAQSTRAYVVIVCAAHKATCRWHGWLSDVHLDLAVHWALWRVAVAVDSGDEYPLQVTASACLCRQSFAKIHGC
jgi:hypothetical protein